jgi:hypothetical protein
VTDVAKIELPLAGQIARGYEPSEIDQFQVEAAPDAVPTDPAVRERYAQALAAEATIYGLPSVYQYAQMVVQVLDTSSPTSRHRPSTRSRRRTSTPCIRTPGST